MISLSSWILLPWNFSGVCAKVQNMLWLKDMVTGVMDHWEYTCQPAETLLRDSSDIMHKNIYNSFILSSMAMKIYRDMGKYMIHTWIKGIAKQRCRLPGTCVITSSNTAVHDRRQYVLSQNCTTNLSTWIKMTKLWYSWTYKIEENVWFSHWG
jgi:hypothetical protein